MTSSDREILISINGQLQSLNERVVRLEDTVARVEQNVDALDRRVTRIEDKVDSLQTSVYWGFAIISLVIAFIGVFVPLIHSSKNSPTSQPINVYTYPTMPTQQKEVKA